MLEHILPPIIAVSLWCSVFTVNEVYKRKAFPKLVKNLIYIHVVGYDLLLIVVYLLF